MVASLKVELSGGGQLSFLIAAISLRSDKAVFLFPAPPPGLDERLRAAHSGSRLRPQHYGGNGFTVLSGLTSIPSPPLNDLPP
jgi:hypothetical protein